MYHNLGGFSKSSFAILPIGNAACVCVSAKETVNPKIKMSLFTRPPVICIAFLLQWKKLEISKNVLVSFSIQLQWELELSSFKPTI